MSAQIDEIAQSWKVAARHVTMTTRLRDLQHSDFDLGIERSLSVVCCHKVQMLQYKGLEKWILNQ